MAPVPSREQELADAWNDVPPRQAPGSREFLVVAELWQSNKTAAVAQRKGIPQRKKVERRDSYLNGVDDSPRKLKDRPSWLNVASVSRSAGQWRSATCKLSEEGENIVLNIYAEDNTLQHSLYVHLMRATDIRAADRSLFFRTDCLGIHCKPGQGFSGTAFLEPVYLAFANTDAINTWVALLRSYALPEVYGRRLAPAQGGLYRMWRQVELVVIQGRNLGSAKLVSDVGSNATPEADNPKHDDASDLDLFCEILLDGEVCGRTTVKKGVGSPYWHEPFSFSDLPPFGLLQVNVWREKKLYKPTFIGTIEVALSNFRRGEYVEGWFPVLLGGTAANGIQVGEVKLKAKVDEEIILPSEAYASILETVDSRNCLDLLSELEHKLRLENVSQHLISLAVGKNVLLHDIFELAEREVDASIGSQNTLFRGNTVFTKTMELSMAYFGKHFLDASIGPVIRRMCAEKVAIEVDPARTNKGLKEVEHNVRLLTYWCEEFWAQIWHVRGECPHELRKVFQHIRMLVETRLGPEQTEQMRWQAVSSFCFLRFIVPAILHPHLFGLVPGLPPQPVQRSLTLVAKVIQSLANLNAAVQKEDFMRGIKEFMQQNLPAMIDYIVVVSTPVPDPFGPFPPLAADRHDRLHVINSLRERSPGMPLLRREAVPILPHLLDVPKHLAILTSAVVRSSRGPRLGQQAPSVFIAGGRPPSTGAEARLEEFTLKCFEVESVALQCVSRLAARPSTSTTSYNRSRSGSGSIMSSAGSPDSAAFPGTPPQATTTPDTSVVTSSSGVNVLPAIIPSAVMMSPSPMTQSISHSGFFAKRKGKSGRPATAPSSTGTGTGSAVSSGISHESLRPSIASRITTPSASTHTAGQVSTPPSILRPNNGPAKSEVSRRPPTAPSGPVRAFGDMSSVGGRVPHYDTVRNRMSPKGSEMMSIPNESTDDMGKKRKLGIASWFRARK